MKKNRSLLLVSALALAGLSVASAKSYSIHIDETLKAGPVTLAPGNYSMKVNGSEAVFKDENGKKVTVPVKIENGDKKHDLTAVESTKTNNGTKIQSIDLGGTTETLEFSE